MLELRELRTGYGGKTALELERLAFPLGMVTGVLGRNGSGKSTLLRTLAGIQPWEGEITVDGISLRALSRRQRARRIAYLPQALPTPELRVETLVAHGRYARLGLSKTLGETDRARIRDALELTELWPLRERPLRTLSGGERQRAFLAMVLAQDGDYLLLDEPGAALDISHREALGALLRRVAASGKGVVVSSHDLSLSFALSDRLILLRQGRLEAEGSPRELVREREALRRSMGALLVPAENPRSRYPYIIGAEE